VVRVERTRVVLATDDDGVLEIPTNEPYAVGDWVVVSDGAIRATLPRRSTLRRIDPNGTSVQVLAANVDLVLVTAPADRMHPARVERELAVAYGSDATPIVVVTKSDLTRPGEIEDLQRRLRGVSVLVTSARTGEGVDAVARTLLPHRTAVLLGPSGAGKSTLVNAMLGEERLAAGAVRSVDGRGRHTTTSRQLVVLPRGGVVIDMPGLRGLGLLGGEVDRVFPEIAELVARCRFDDCRHDGEPGCAVAAGLAAGRFTSERLANYRKLSGSATPSAAPRPRRPTHQHRSRRHERPPSADEEMDGEETEREE
jgi:ribosome biogenesis GTPase